MADDRPRSGFAPTVGLGLVTAAVGSVASAKAWFRLASGSPALPGVPPSERTIDMPLALALSLVVLAGWGAVLVSRGAWRRVLVAIALVAALGLVACAAAAPFVLPDDLRDALGPTSAGLAVRPTGWFMTAAVASLLSLAALVAAWRLAPRWPTMSSRYDAPAARASEPDETDLWKALDAGHDPTDPST
ncbi:MAG: Trp biosynthesis-associated membrane protein [Propionibacteriales bacterium]|nr:Trp biosynthesis-associated membrane protein [Propionibacteriales bacterium]